MSKMRRNVGLLVLIACLAGGCGLSKPNGLSPEVADALVLKADLGVHWELPLELTGRDEIDRLFLVDDMLYCLTRENLLLAIDAERGYVLWSHRVAPEGEKVFAPIHQDGMSITPEPATISDLLEPENVERLPLFDATIINSVAKIMVFRRDTGEIIRDLPLKFAANTGCASDGSQVYIGAANGLARGVKIESGTHTWGLATGGGLFVAPRVHGGMVFVGALERFHAVRTLSVTAYEPQWSQQLNNGHVMGQFHVDARGCFVPSTNNSLYAFSPYTGLPVWKRFICESPLDAPVQVGERTIFQRSRKGILYALDVTNGSLRWSLADARMVLGVHQGAVYVLDDHQNLRVVDEVLGTERASLPLSGLDVYVGNVSGPAVYAASQAGTIICLRPDGEDALASGPAGR